ncbi:MAG: ATP-dependent DNA helicase RecG [Micrococcales bacterium]|nr:ATP-dependent DNA helicase RecG [Micrococcales bacterium]
MAHLGSPLADVLGGRSAGSLHKSHGVSTCEDLLWVFPRRYQDMTRLTDIGGLHVGDVATVLARVKNASTRSTRNGRMLNAVITDGRNDLHLAFFRRIQHFEEMLRPGRVGLFSGKVGAYRGQLQLAHPMCVMSPKGVGDDAEEVEAFLATINPIYPATASIPSWRVGKSVKLVLDAVDLSEDPVDELARQKRALLGQQEAFQALHTPTSLDLVEPARRRFTYQEAYVLQTVLALRRQAMAHSRATARPGSLRGLAAAIEDRLPFALTTGQQEAVAAIRADLAEPTPMQRLLHGEVGAGKTLVALLAMATVVDSGGQAVLLAPTEVLAQQHHASISALLGELAHAGTLLGGEQGTQVVLLTGSAGAAARRDALLQIVSGQAGIVVGTHALLSEAVQFAELGLVVVDEQHRFGVEQRAALLDRGAGASRPHLLVMTATPIPRTVAMTVFGDLDVTTLRELPANRAGVSTFVVNESLAPRHAERTWERVVEEVSAGRKVYVVCPRIGDGATFEPDPDLPEDLAELDFPTPESTRGVLQTAEELADGPLAGVRVSVMHGRLPAAEKSDVMRRFAADPATADAIDVLVATSVIEVGVDVPSATVMVVLDAESFGVSQLHQLRGRVGRADLPGLCLLCTRNPEATERLEKVAATTNGFDLARIDLEQRKEGDVLGTAQSGRLTRLRLLRVIRDEQIIEQARADVADLLARDPGLREHATLRAMVNRWQSAGADYVEKT